MTGYFRVIIFELLYNNRSKGIGDASPVHFVSGSDNAGFFQRKGEEGENGFSSGGLLCLIHGIHGDDKGNDSGSQQLVTGPYGSVTMAGGNHHLSEGIDGFQLVTADFK